ncbi:MAG: MerR family transcriptional regulator [Pseudobacter sp.]|uniref:MerR family transcriptional regulator n=1 Tax=Pseudobacter sp. TaxID=2045420 RepID=UPI003F7DDAEA
MRLYHISELEQLSGIKATTIRVWERRYDLIRPGRTDTNIRMYDDDQVRKLLNVSTLLASGMKISSIAELNEHELHAAVSDLKNGDAEGDDTALAFVNDMVGGMLELDEVACEKVYSAAIKKYGVFDAMLKVVYPFLQKIGLMWSVEDATPVQEHFASCLVRRKLLAATDMLTVRRKNRKTFILMLPPGEWHEIGLLFANYIIRSKGAVTIYLGQNVPYEQVPQILERTVVSHVLLFFTTRTEEDNLSDLRKRMQLPRDISLLVAGSAAVLGQMKNGRHTHLLASPSELLDFL